MGMALSDNEGWIGAKKEMLLSNGAIVGSCSLLLHWLYLVVPSMVSGSLVFVITPTTILGYYVRIILKKPGIFI